MITVHLDKKRSIEVPSHKAASVAVQAHWAGRGYTAYYRDSKAGLIEEDGKAVAHVSYNGRVWEGTQRYTLGAKEITL